MKCFFFGHKWTPWERSKKQFVAVTHVGNSVFDLIIFIRHCERCFRKEVKRNRHGLMLIAGRE